MKLVGRLLSVLMIVGTVLAMCLPADAGAYVYSGKRKKIYCGVVGLGNSVDTNGNPAYTNRTDINYVTQPITDKSGNILYYNSMFSKLDSLDNMKPAGWTLENPLSKTQDKYAFDYWVVSASSARNLSRFNVLYLPGSGNISLSDDERENLRRFVDGGGVLWVDNTRDTLPMTFSSSGPFFISQLQFSSTSNTADTAVSRHHPLLCSPYWLTDADILSLGKNADSTWSHCYCNLGSSVAYDALNMIINSNIGFGSDKPAVVANAYGSGRVVATANAVGRGCLLNSPSSQPSLKFAYNIMAYPSTWTDIRKNPRHSGASIDTLGSNKLVEKWSLTSADQINKKNVLDSATSSPTANKECAPLIYKNTVFYTSGSTLYALDQNGDTNNGVWPRTSNGGAALIWNWPNNGNPQANASLPKLSPPTIATVVIPDKSTGVCTPHEAVMVMDESGTVTVLEAFPLGNGGIASPITLATFSTAALTSGTSSDYKWPSPPIYNNGWIYALGGDGQLYADNPCLDTGSSNDGKWKCPDLAKAGYTAPPKSGPSFGYTRNSTNGAIVGVIYWFNAPETAPLPPSAGSPQNDHMLAVPVSVSMDRISSTSNSIQYDTTRTNVQFFVTYPGYLVAPDPGNANSAIRIYKSDGVTPFTGWTATISPSGNGQITINSPSAEIPTNALIYASYSLYYKLNDTICQPRMMDVEIEPKIFSGAYAHGVTRISGTPAMGSDNMLYICGQRDQVASIPTGGSILAYQNDGAGSGTSTNKLKWHYFLHSGLDSSTYASYMPGINVQLPGVVETSGTSPVAMLDPQPSSSPAIAGNKLFVTVSGATGSNNNPKAALLCLKANPEFVIRINEGGGYTNKQPKNLWKQDGTYYSIKLWQPSLINVPDKAVPLVDAIPAPAPYTTSNGMSVDYTNGTITINDFASVKLNVGGMNTNTFSPSLPVWVWLDNIEVPIDWSTWGPGSSIGSSGPLTQATSDSVDLSGWNNLMWYYIVPDHKDAVTGTTYPCSGVHSPPIVIGTTVYFMCDDGVLYALDTETGESSGKVTTKDPIWTQAVGQYTPTSGHTINTKAAVSVAGANGALIVPGIDGLHAFTNTTTLVTDNSRIVELDGDGEVTWAVDSIMWPSFIPTTVNPTMAMRQGPVNKPSRARYASTGEILFANSGMNQVCKIDKSGTVGIDNAGSGSNILYVRWIYDKFTDPKHLLRSGQSLRLNSPTDAILWQEMEPVQTSSSPGTSVVHCLIADSGNSRILDLVYRVKSGKFVDYNGDVILDDDAHLQYFDPDGHFLLPELNWVTKTDSLNERYAFNCIQLVGNTNSSTNNFNQDIWAASSNYASTGTALDAPSGSAGLGGAILKIAYRKYTGDEGWNYTTTDSGESGTIVARCDHVSIDSKSVPLANPRYFDILTDASGDKSLLICDNYGVYKADLQTPPALPIVSAHLWESEYRSALRSFEKDPSAPSGTASPDNGNIDMPLVATSVQNMINGHWLITNNYAGPYHSGALNFGGEVFEYDSSITASPLSVDAIPWYSPHLQRIWDTTLATPAWGDWRQISTNTSMLKQPNSAYRPL